jgi:sulfate transport system substrate-binding protein
LLKPGVQVITPNPKTSGGARWNFLAALAWAQRQPGATDASAAEFIRALFRQVPVLDTGARGATTSFAQRALGDVLIAWENEAFLVRKEFGETDFETVLPSVSVLAEPPVAVVDSVVDKHGTRAVAEAYLKYLYTPEGQEIVARNFYRPRDPAVAARYAATFPPLAMASIKDFGGWDKAQADYFADGGLFDRIYVPGK